MFLYFFVIPMGKNSYASLLSSSLSAEITYLRFVPRNIKNSHFLSKKKKTQRFPSIFHNNSFQSYLLFSPFFFLFVCLLRLITCLCIAFDCTTLLLLLKFNICRSVRAVELKWSTTRKHSKTSRKAILKKKKQNCLLVSFTDF